MLAINEFSEFLSSIPTHPRADYAQFKLGMSHFYQMRDPMRDQTETLEAIRELTPSSSGSRTRSGAPCSPEAQRGCGKRATASASTSSASASNTTGPGGIPARSSG